MFILNQPRLAEMISENIESRAVDHYLKVIWSQKITPRPVGQYLRATGSHSTKQGKLINSYGLYEARRQQIRVQFVV